MIRLKKVLYLATLAAVVLLGITSWLIQSRIENEARLEVGETLTTVLETTHQAVNSWLKEIKSAALVWAATDDIRSAAAQLLTVPANQAALCASHTQARLRAWFEPLREVTSYQGYFIIDPDHINLASSRDRNIGMKNLLITQESFFQKVWSGETAVSLPEKSEVPLPDHDGQLREGVPTMFVGAPIFNEAGDIIAIFTLRINPEEDFSTILQQGRIGRTGETYAFDDTGRLISNSRFDSQLRAIGLVPPEGHGILNIELRDPGVDLTRGKPAEMSDKPLPLTQMVAAAIAGRSGLELRDHRDYRGVPVVSAWLWDSELGFGIATELDVSEAFRTLRVTRRVIAVLTLFIALLLTGCSVIYVFYRQRKFAEEGLRDREERIRSLLESVGEGVYGVDMEGKCTFVNSAALHILGFDDAAQLVGKDIHTMIHHTRRDGSPCPAEECRIYRAFREQKGFYVNDEVMWHTDGTSFDVEYRSNPIFQDGKIAGSVASFTDVTERKRAEQALRESEQKHRQIFESVLDVYAEIGLDGTLLEVSPSVEAQTGYTRRELLGRHMADFYARPGDRDKLLEQLYRDGFINDYEVLLLDKNGSEHPYSFTGKIITDPVGKPLKLAGVMRDISDRAREERKTRALLESVPDAMVVTNRHREIVLINAQTENLFGYKKEELLGQKIDRLLPEYLRARHEAHCEAYFSAPRTRTMEAAPGLVAMRKDGSLMPVEISLSPFQIEDELLVLSAVRDVTERKKAEQALRESEARFRQLAENVREVFWISSADGHQVIYVSPAYQDVWGRSAQSLYEQPENWIEVIHTQDRERVAEAFFNNAAKGGYDEEFRIVRPDGSERWIRDRGFPVLNESGEVYRVAGIAEDITASKKLHEQLEILVSERTAELQRSNRELVRQMTERAHAEEQARMRQAELAHMARLNTMGEMATGIAHELNQPLTAIATYSDVALRMARAGITQPEKLTEALEGARDQAVRAADIIRHLRQFVSKQSPQMTRVDLNELVSEAVGFVENEMSKKGIRLLLQLDKILPMIFADGIQIEQVLLNLVRNSIEAMQLAASRTQELTIHTGTENGWVQAMVADSGPGMDAETLSHIFEPFVTTKGSEGMGMGLSISRSIIEAHGGRLWAESEPGRGARFFFNLPAGRH